MDDWKSKILDKTELDKTEFVKSELDSSIYTVKMKKTLGMEFHEKMPKGAALRELKEQHLHLSY